MSFIQATCSGSRTGGNSVRSPPRLPATALLIILVLVTSSTGQAAELDTVAFFKIDAKTLDGALLQFAAQAHVQISFAWDSATSERRTKQLQGLYTGKEVLTALLKGTKLTYVVDRHTIAIHYAAKTHHAVPQASSNALGVSQHIIDSVKSGDPPTRNDPPATRGYSSHGLREVIVTAQKYREPAFDVPISLQVLDGEELQQHGVTDLSNLQYDVPGLYMDNTGTTHSVYLRGVGNYLGNGAMVGQYIDDADMTAETNYTGTQGYGVNDGGLYDLQRVEVLKGPQGTLYGDGSMGGVIRYITNKPALDRFEMAADVAALFTEYGAPGQRTNAMLNTPLVNGTLGLRFAGVFEHDGGWVDEPAANLKNINGGNLADVRAEALWYVADRLNLNFTEIIHRSTSGIGAGEDASRNIEPLFDTTYTPTLENSSNLSNMTLTYDFGRAQLLSSSTYLKGEENIYNQYSAEAVPTYTTDWFLEPYVHVNEENYSEEVRLVNEGEGPWHWSAGGFFKDYRDGIFYPGEYFGLAGSSLPSALRESGTNGQFSSSSWAGFADTSYQLFKRLTFGMGVRYFKDRQTKRSAREVGYLPPAADPTTVPTPYGAATFTSTDPRFYVQYGLTRHINTYASASKGFRSGGFNTPPAPNYGPEVLWSYDLGTKIRLPERSLQADVDLFDMTYTNYVSDTYIPPVYLLANVGKARIRGLDADFRWRPVDQWILSVNTEILHSQFLTASTISGYAPGERLPFAPTYSFTASIQRDFMWNGRSGDAEVYYYEISRVQYRLAGVPLFESDVLHFLNLRTEIHCNDNLTLGLFAHNLLNDHGNESPLYYTGASVRPRPRTFGVEFSVRFGK